MIFNTQGGGSPPIKKNLPGSWSLEFPFGKRQIKPLRLATAARHRRGRGREPPVITGREREPPTPLFSYGGVVLFAGVFHPG